MQPCMFREVDFTRPQLPLLSVTARPPRNVIQKKNTRGERGRDRDNPCIDPAINKR